MEVFATVVGRADSERLMELSFIQQAAELIQIPSRELFLLWNADTRTYDGHIDHDSKGGLT